MSVALRLWCIFFALFAAFLQEGINARRISIRRPHPNSIRALNSRPVIGENYDSKLFQSGEKILLLACE